MSSNDKDDEFWAVALMGETTATQSATREEQDDENGDTSDENMAFQDTVSPSRFDRYAIPNSNGVMLTVNPLPLHDGILSPLGAHAWYGSALLGAYIAGVAGCRSPLKARIDQPGDVTALELGSGAVGIAGLCMTWRLKQKNGGFHQVIMSDNEDVLLRQLNENVSNNLHILDRGNEATTVDCRVVLIDWDKSTDWDSVLGGRLDIIFGSELVYTPENAAACRDCILALTQLFPHALVCICQIVDREGWGNIFLPGLRHAGLFVVEEAVDVDCDGAANLMMKRGGSLDRFDFGICYISRSKF